MADLIPAKAGDTLSTKARRALAKALGFRLAANEPIPPSIPETVKPKAEGIHGQWFDIDDGYFAQNNSDAYGHSERLVSDGGGRFRKHRWAWRNFATGEIEEP